MQETESQSEKQLRQEERWERAITISVLAIIAFGILTMAAQDASIRHRSCITSCVANLKMIEGAKATWALENQKSDTDVPTDAELFGETNYIRVKPACPMGGKYSIGPVAKQPRCTVAGHVL